MKPGYYIVEGSALPEIFIKVVEAKQYLSSGKVRTVKEAVNKAGISRSAFYKYKDLISPFYEMASGKILTFYMVLEDEPGILSGVLRMFAKSGANILTINQSIPVNGQAPVTITADTASLTVSLQSFVRRALELNGVIKFEALAGK
jgi:chorismate mutase